MNRLHNMPFGAEPTGQGGARVRLWAPAASRVVLVRSGEGPDLGSFPMQVQDGGWFELELPRTQVRTDYAFSIDGGVVVPDPASRSNRNGVHGPSTLVDPSAFAWTDDAWRGRPWHEAVIYELHVGALGDAAGARDRDQRLVVTVGVEVDAIFQRIAEVALQGAAHRMDLFETAIADQANIETLAHQDAVEHGGAGIDAGRQFRIDVVHGPVPVRQRIDRGVVDGERLVARVALRLADDKAAVLSNEEGVGHRATGIDAHHLYGGLHLHVVSWVGFEWVIPRRLHCNARARAGRSSAFQKTPFNSSAYAPFPDLRGVCGRCLSPSGFLTPRWMCPESGRCRTTFVGAPVPGLSS